MHGWTTRIWQNEVWFWKSVAWNNNPQKHESEPITYVVRCGQTDLTRIFDALHHTHVCVWYWMGLFTRLTNTYCGKTSRKYRTTNEHSTFMSTITSHPMWLNECNLSAKIYSDGHWHDFIWLSVEFHSQYMFVVDVIFKLFFMNLFLLCQANKQPKIFFQQISRHMIPVC